MEPFLPFSCNLDTFIQEFTDLLETNKSKIQDLIAIPKKTYNNFVKPLEDLEESVELFFTPLSHLNSVENTTQTQKIYTKALSLITEYSTHLSQNISLYKGYKEILQQHAETLTPEQIHLLKLNILHFELSGAHLDKQTKERLQQIQLQKSELSNQFSQNLLDATNSYEYIITNPKDVEGLPQSEIENAKFEKDGQTCYRFTLQMPSYIAYMTYGKNRQIREELYKAYTTRAPQNSKLIDQILALRHEMAQLLGFENYAQYSLASKMAPNTQSVLDFLEELRVHSLPKAQEELEKLQNIAQHPLHSYDLLYYSELLKQQDYSINEEEYRPYFEQSNVVKGMLTFLEKMFHLRFQKVDEKLWNDKAFCYDIYQNNKLLSRIYFDLEARKSKRGGAWMDNWQTHHCNAHGKQQLASAFVVCNFPPSTQTQKSLLRHDDVVTLFHEMGHALHHTLSQVKDYEISGVNGVEWDAVEYPSQLLENFAYEPQVLQLFAQHVSTGEILPDKMIDKLVASKNFLSAIGMLRQLEFSLFDFQLHLKLYQGEQIDSLLNTIRETTSLIKPPQYNRFQNGFAHIFAGGYAAGYYSYKWAEVLSADTFYAIVDEGIFQSKTAQKYAEVILKKGGSSSMQQLYIQLMDSNPNTQQLLRFNGIIS